MEREELFKRLIEAYKNKTATSQELEVLMHLLREGSVDSFLLEEMNQDAELNEEAVIPFRSQPNKFRRWLPYVAASFVLVAAGTFFFKYQSSVSAHITREEVVNDAHPGGNYATLTLENGQIIPLDEAGEGEIIRQSGLVVRKTNEGRLVYETVQQPELEKVSASYNSVSTPRGGQYQVVLADGTRVWLNAASSLRYPIIFPDSIRLVELNGEGFFEVSANPNAPFIVISRNQRVRVTGTRFNINAYSEEPTVKTTLLEGKVTVELKDGRDAIALHPGEQSLLKQEKLIVQPVDTDLVTDWKNGDFIFDNEDIRSIMRRIARWYDVEIVYDKGYIHDIGFFGHVSRTKKLSEVLQVLELTGAVRFEVDGKTVMVMAPE